MPLTPPPSPPDESTLCPDDAAVLDAYLAHRAMGLTSGPMPPASGQRLDKVVEVLGVLDHYPVDEPSVDLVRHTLARVESERNRRQFAQQVAMLAQPRRTLGVHWSQILSAAAIFVIGASLLLPVLERNRDDAHRVVGAANFGMAAKAFDQYAQNNRGFMPKYATRPNSTWWNLGQVEGDYAQSNSAHLYKLVRDGYLKPQHLADPSNPHAPGPGEMTDHDYDWKAPEQISYSYQNQHGRRAIKLLDQPNMVILAYKNPLFVARKGKVAYDRSVSPQAASRIARGRGQQMLFNDGHVRWSCQPIVTHPTTGQADNIYRAQGIDHYTGTETPSSPGDTFLVP